MHLGELIGRFSTLTHAPIKINQVREAILSFGLQDEIVFVGVDLDTEVVRGSVVQYTYRNGVYAEPTRATDVYFAKSLPLPWKRLVICKELLHIFDGPLSRTATREDAEVLLRKIVLVPQLVETAEEIRRDGIQVWTDRLQILTAAALLFPQATRDLLLPKLQANSISLEDIERVVQLPFPYVQMVMSDFWPACYESVVKFASELRA
jgi:hypothetical protein